ncbi:MAG: hormogonium polysaccharide biosynthesis glycosyltransferase HpsE [Cyanobacteria bacterium J06598_3]
MRLFEEGSGARMIDFSVAIRTYNRAGRLPGLLAALRSQLNTDHFTWEVVIVNNNSTDNTAEVIARLAPTLPVPVRTFFEPTQGASFARARAIAEAKGTFIGFLDDDNLPAPNWVSTAHRFGLAHPRTAAFGSQIHGRFEVIPPARFERIAAFLPVVERSHDVCFTAGQRRLSNLVPPGAGLVIRAEAWKAHVPEQLTLKGPVADSLAQKGEDVEALMHLKKAGWDIWFHAQLHIEHLIGPERLERQYLVSFFRGVGRSRHLTRMVSYRPAYRLPMVCLHFVNDARKLLLYRLRHWPFGQFERSRLVQGDVVALCEWTLLRSSLLSPLTSGLLKGKWVS